MDGLDALLFEAWNEVSKELQDKPWKLARRMERVARKELRRPVRAWCVAIRASDTRIGACDLRTEFSRRCWARGFNHRFVLRGERLRELCRPVRIVGPGVTVVDAAALLGRDVRTVRAWMKKGRLAVDRDGVVGAGTAPKHLVRSGPMDPQADDGLGPWEVWGTQWQGLWERVPLDFKQRVERTARVRRLARDDDRHPGHYCGWDWVCPGRVVVDGTTTGRHVPCGRICKKLWLPLPAWTIGDYLGDRAGQAWGAMPRFEFGASRLACARCWGLRFEPFKSDPAEAWNRFVSVVSGGLLYGREVLPPREVLGALY